MTWVEPLALQTILVNILAGNVELFTFIAFIVIAVLAARFQMPNQVTLMMFILFVVIMNTYLNFGGLYILVILVTGLVTFYALKKLWE